MDPGLYIDGDVHLILTENCVLKPEGGCIQISAGSSLTVYGSYTGKIDFTHTSNSDGHINGIISGDANGVGKLAVHGGRMELGQQSDRARDYMGIQADVTMYGGYISCFSGRVNNGGYKSYGVTGSVTMYGGLMRIENVNQDSPVISGDVTMYGGILEAGNMSTTTGRTIGGNVICHKGCVRLKNSQPAVGGTLTMTGGYIYPTQGNDMTIGNDAAEAAKVSVTGGVLLGYNPTVGDTFSDCVAGGLSGAQVYGNASADSREMGANDVQLIAPVTVPAGATLEIPTGSEIIINKTLVNHGTVTGGGRLLCRSNALCTRGDSQENYGTYNIRAERQLKVSAADTGIGAYSVTLNPVTGAGEDGWYENPPQPEYAISTTEEKPADDSSVWQTGLTFDNLQSGRDYYFFARVKGGDIYKDAGYGADTYFKNFSKITTKLQTYNVTFSTGEGTQVNSQTVSGNWCAAEPEAPSRDGYAFGGWYKDSDCTDGNEFDFDTPVKADLTLYAKWVDTSNPTGTIYVRNGSTEKSWNSLQANIIFDLFYNSELTIEIEGGDIQSGIKKIQYLISDTEIGNDNLKERTDWKDYNENAAPSVSTEGQYIVYAKITNGDDLVTYISSDGIVMDMTAPAVSGIENGKVYCMAVQVNVSDANLAGVTLDGTDIESITGTAGAFTVNSKDGTQVIIAEDKAGNITTYTIEVKTAHKQKTAANCHSGAICENCGQSYGEKNPDNHDGATEIRDAVTASCTQGGYTGDTYCKGCGEKIADGTVTDKTAHTESSWITDREATETSEGSRHKECTVCKKVMVTETIPEKIPETTTTEADTTGTKEPSDTHEPDDEAGTKAPASPYTGQNTEGVRNSVWMLLMGAAVILIGMGGYRVFAEKKK